MALIREALKDEPRIQVASYNKLTVDYAREVGAQAIIRGLRVFSDFELEFRMALANRRLARRRHFFARFEQGIEFFSVDVYPLAVGLIRQRDT